MILKVGHADIILPGPLIGVHQQYKLASPPRACGFPRNLLPSADGNTKQCGRGEGLGTRSKRLKSKARKEAKKAASSGPTKPAASIQQSAPPKKTGSKCTIGNLLLWLTLWQRRRTRRPRYWQLLPELSAGSLPRGRSLATCWLSMVFRGTQSPTRRMDGHLGRRVGEIVRRPGINACQRPSETT